MTANEREVDETEMADQNLREKTPNTARMAHDQALGKVMLLFLKDDTQVYKYFIENESFRRCVGNMADALTNSWIESNL